MNIEIKIRSINDRRRDLHRFIEEQVKELKKDLPITEAHVLVEHQADVTPAFWTCVRLAVPGRDVFACGRDHTPLAALLKVRKELEAVIKRRKARQVSKRKSNLRIRGAKGKQTGASSNRRT
ncbi:MAG: HPF/RaiA family ribosome-associated protein [Verrucomicrobiia bacterium]